MGHFCIALFFIKNELTALYTFTQPNYDAGKVNVLELTSLNATRKVSLKGRRAALPLTEVT